MPQLLWDASALVKRYASEQGSDTVDALFAAALPVPMVTAYLVYAEVCASLRRKLTGQLHLRVMNPVDWLNELQSV